MGSSSTELFGAGTCSSIATTHRWLAPHGATCDRARDDGVRVKARIGHGDADIDARQANVAAEHLSPEANRLARDARPEATRAE